MHTSCKSCGKAISGNYCSNCGEKVVTPKERTFLFQLGKIVNAITFADTKMLQTLWLVIRRPGRLSSDYAEGKRVPYSSPLALFFIGNLIYFLMPMLETFNTTLDVQMHGMPYGAITTKAVENRIERENISMEEFTSEYNVASTSNAKLLLIFMVFYMVPAYAILCHRKGIYFADHFVMSLELSIYNIFVNTIFFGLLLFPVVSLFRLSGTDITPYLNDRLITIVVLISLIYFLYSSMRNMYGWNAAGALVRSFLIIAWLVVSLIAYRLTLFWASFYMV